MKLRQFIISLQKSDKLYLTKKMETIKDLFLPNQQKIKNIPIIYYQTITIPLILDPPDFG